MINFLFNKKTTIPILRLSGVISQSSGIRGGLSHQGSEKLIEKLFSDKKSPAVAIVINSPGGSPTQSSLIANEIINKAQKHKKKVIAFVEDVAASGGYWLACSADEIYIDKNSIVGSIGVISPSFGFVGLLKKIGIERRVYTSGKSKSFLDPFKQAKQEDIKRLKDIQNQIHNNFIDYVQSRRRSKINKSNYGKIFSGMFWIGEKAISLGLADGIGDYKTILRKKFGDKIKIKLIEQKKSFFQKRFSSNIKYSLLDKNSIIDYFEEQAYWSRFGL
ncbi:MAG: putative signal peptide peptidase SppA [Alphaproteobacteria bacterium MarineAlpha5_Bin9]|nr:MAG: putative signal peptide peptidase SppA [Alphaproteobacteria bacterium MarineAlpha5_Bin9]|tara:strand:+ start:6489 stop:7313 length:825 start_codon:yes stop_codon:yes gene_type:complete